METEIEQEECDVKWNGVGFGVRGSEQGSGMGNMKQTNIRNMKCVGERNQEWGYERISRNDKAGDNGLNRARPEDRRSCVLDPKLGRSSEGDLGHSSSVSREILSIVPRIVLSFGFSLIGESSIICDDDATGGAGAVSDCSF